MTNYSVQWFACAWAIKRRVHAAYDWLSKSLISRRKSWHHPQHQTSEFSHISWSSCSSPWVWQRSPSCCPWVFWQWMHNFWWDPKTVKEQVINSGNTCWEFSQLKMTLKGHGRMNFKTTRGLIMWGYKVFFSPEFAKLGLCIPVTSVPAEHGISIQNRMKTARRSSLSESRVNRMRLMLLLSEANFLDHLSLVHAANIFNSMQQWQK